MSLQSLLSIAKSALGTQQRALDVTSHNIANVNTAGYTRQRLAMQAMTPLLTPQGPVGRGVTDVGVFAARDGFLDGAFRRETGTQGYADTLRDMLSRVEDVFGEPSDSGISGALDGFWNAFADLANDPSSAAAKTLVQQAGRTLTRQFQQTDARLTQLSGENADRLKSQVADVNAIASQIADLNKRIVATGGEHHSAPDLEDQRSQLIDKLSTMAGVRVLPRDDGSVGVLAGDTLLVDGAQAQTLEVKSIPAGGWGVAVQGSSTILDTGAGSLKALSDMTATKIPQVQAQLDQLANAIVTQVNAIHQTGTLPGPVTGTNFFDPAGTTARTISLTAAVDANASAIATGTTANAGDNSVALQLSQLRTTALAGLGGASAGDFYTGVVAQVGSLVKDASVQSDAAATLVQSADQQRSSESGVSLDEEMVSLTIQQQAYTAATRLVQIANDMMDDLLKMV